MDAILDFFAAIGDIIGAIIDFVISLFQDLIYMIQLLGQIVVNIPVYFSWLPSTLVTMVVVIFGIVVIYKILGREG